MPHNIRVQILAVVIGTLIPCAWAQYRDPAEFSRIPDPTNVQLTEYQEYERGLLTFSSRARYVLVPAVVTDKDGNPVARLTKEDFRLQENRKDQVIASIDEIVPMPGPSASYPTTQNNVVSNELAIQSEGPRRLTIIALDMVNTPLLDQARSRQQVIEYFSKSLEPDSLYQIISIEKTGLVVLHDYTQSTADLIKTVKRIHSRFTPTESVDQAATSDFSSKGLILGPGGAATGTPGTTSVGPTTLTYSIDPKSDFDGWVSAVSGAAERPYAAYLAAAAANSTLTAFHQIAQRTSGIPGRKSLIWITGGFPFSVDPATARVSSGIPFGVYQHVMQELGDQMIALYPIDARGLLTLNVDATVHVTKSMNAFPTYALADNTNRQRDVFDTMHSFADMTGGSAYLNTNDITGAVHSAAMDGAHYYLLSYPLDTNNRQPGWRRITLKAGKYTVRARMGYYLTQSTVNPVASASFDLDMALRSPFDYTGIPLRLVTKSQVDPQGKKTVTFSATIPLSGIQVDASDRDNNHLFIEIAYAALRADGSSYGRQDKTYNLSLNAEQLSQFQSQGLGFGDSVELAPGSQRLRVVVRDNLNGRVGSVLAEFHTE